MKARKTIYSIGYASGIAAGNNGCGDGPDYLKKSNLGSTLESEGIILNWEKFIYPKPLENKSKIVKDLCEELAVLIKDHVEKHEKFIVFGGDHSSGIGTWSGAFGAKKKKEPIGLIWVDAHLDSHVSETSPSGNIHGMPVAALLGYGSPELTHIMGNEAKILPQNLCFVGIRSFEEGEADLIQRLGIRVYDIAAVKERGIKVIMQEAKDYVSQNTVGYGLSVDLDGLDPQDAPGVGTPEQDGILVKDFCEALKPFHDDPRLLGVEIAEYNPHLDKNQLTIQSIKSILSALFA